LRRRLGAVYHHCISSEGQLTVRDIVRRSGVSQVTARGDLDPLCELGLVERSHGGAVRSFDPLRDYSIQVKAALNRPEKVRIARAAVNLIQKNQTVILDSGTTTTEIARNIAQLEYHPVRVITNALNIAEVLADAQKSP
jgi:DeoR family transcriptional regulator of aga operon